MISFLREKLETYVSFSAGKSESKRKTDRKIGPSWLSLGKKLDPIQRSFQKLILF